MKQKKIPTSAKKLEKGLTEKQKAFCRAYILEWNATRSYLEIYKSVSSYNVAGVNANRLLKNAKIQAYIEEIQKDLEKVAGISRLKVLNEHIKIAFSSLGHMYCTWITRKEFETLTDDQKACIAEIDTKIKTEYEYNPDNPKERTPVNVEYVKIKLHDKQKSLDSITKMLGYDPAGKVEVTGKDGKDLIPAARILTKDEARELLRKLENDF
jgi:phage terminase small subunit